MSRGIQKVGSLPVDAVVTPAGGDALSRLQQRQRDLTAWNDASEALRSEYTAYLSENLQALDPSARAADPSLTEPLSASEWLAGRQLEDLDQPWLEAARSRAYDSARPKPLGDWITENQETDE